MEWNYYCPSTKSATSYCIYNLFLFRLSNFLVLSGLFHEFLGSRVSLQARFYLHSQKATKGKLVAQAVRATRGENAAVTQRPGIYNPLLLRLSVCTGRRRIPQTAKLPGPRQLPPELVHAYRQQVYTAARNKSTMLQAMRPSRESSPLFGWRGWQGVVRLIFCWRINRLPGQAAARQCRKCNAVVHCSVPGRKAAPGGSWEGSTAPRGERHRPDAKQVQVLWP